jgi:hypothetical protein
MTIQKAIYYFFQQKHFSFELLNKLFDKNIALHVLHFFWTILHYVGSGVWHYIICQLSRFFDVFSL